jgi:hypothetical protein
MKIFFAVLLALIAQQLLGPWIAWVNRTLLLRLFDETAVNFSRRRFWRRPETPGPRAVR